MPSRHRRLAVLAAWITLLAGAVVTLHAAGDALPVPPLGAPSGWPRWAEGRDPVVVAFAVVRVLALVVAWYGLAVTAAGVGLRLVSARRAALLVDRLTVVPLRRLVAATVAAGISAGPIAAAGAATPAPQKPPVTITMHLVDPDAGAPAPVPATVPGEGHVGATATVQPGQCFWSIAEGVLGRAWGRAPTDAEIVPYWRLLVEANRAVLADPNNPDLVFPGQVFSLPEV